ncbi:MAG TPA: hypothetical protein VF624_14410 [Tepidisphaeraceae bacterium]|jgi:hypothetical protein
MSIRHSRDVFLVNVYAVEEWDIRREGYAWPKGVALPRFDLAPRKIEPIYGKLFWADSERLTMLALLLENLGTDVAVKLGSVEA